MLADIERLHFQANILFLNTDAGFNSEGFLKICFQKSIVPNIEFNKRNSKNFDSQPLLNDTLY